MEIIEETVYKVGNSIFTDKVKAQDYLDNVELAEELESTYIYLKDHDDWLELLIALSCEGFKIVRKS